MTKRPPLARPAKCPRPPNSLPATHPHKPHPPQAPIAASTPTPSDTPLPSPPDPAGSCRTGSCAFTSACGIRQSAIPPATCAREGVPIHSLAPGPERWVRPMGTCDSVRAWESMGELEKSSRRGLGEHGESMRRAWGEHGESMRRALGEHEKSMRRALGEHEKSMRRALGELGESMGGGGRNEWQA